jgi:hypothetical protein
MADWRIIEDNAVELVNGHPPYQWKHGWIPITPDAHAIKAKKKSGSAGVAVKDKPSKVNLEAKKAADLVDEGEFTPDQLQSLPNSLKFRLPQEDPHEWRTKIRKHLEANPVKAAPDKPKASSVSTGGPDSLQHMSDSQRVLWDEANGRGSDDTVTAAQRVTSEWEDLDSAPEPTPEELEAMEYWQFGQDEDTGEMFYRLLNRMKREGDGDLSAPDTDVDLGELDQALQSRLSKSKTKRSLTLFRGIQHVPERGQFQVGDTITDPGWAATSYNPVTANSFRQAAFGKMLVIHAPKGTPVVRLSDEMQEWEVLLGPDTPMRVTRIDGDEIHVRVEAKK